MIFSIQFSDPDDAVLAKVFLQEFIDAKRQINNAPTVAYAKDPPMELQGLNVKSDPSLAFVSMILMQAHLTGSIRDRTLNLVPAFRDYLHYHIKCSKAHLHSRMRKRVEMFLLLLNKAKPEKPAEERVKKTYEGKTFVQRK